MFRRRRLPCLLHLRLLSRLHNMPRWLHGTLHVLAVGAVAGLTVAKAVNPLAAAGISAAQAMLGVAMQSFNTDGTPQTVAFVPKPKK